MGSEAGPTSDPRAESRLPSGGSARDVRRLLSTTCTCARAWEVWVCDFCFRTIFVGPHKASWTVQQQRWAL